MIEVRSRFPTIESEPHYAALYKGSVRYIMKSGLKVTHLPSGEDSPSCLFDYSAAWRGRYPVR